MPLNKQNFSQPLRTIDNGKWTVDNDFMMESPNPFLTFTPLREPIIKEVTPSKSRTNSLLQEGHFDPRSKWGGPNRQCI